MYIKTKYLRYKRVEKLPYCLSKEEQSVERKGDKESTRDKGETKRKKNKKTNKSKTNSVTFEGSM